MYLNAWPMGSGIIRRHSIVGVGVALLEEVCHRKKVGFVLLFFILNIFPTFPFFWVLCGKRFYIIKHRNGNYKELFTSSTIFSTPVHPFPFSIYGNFPPFSPQPVKLSLSPRKDWKQVYISSLQLPSTKQNPAWKGWVSHYFFLFSFFSCFN